MLLWLASTGSCGLPRRAPVPHRPVKCCACKGAHLPTGVLGCPPGPQAAEDPASFDANCLAKVTTAVIKLG